MKRKPPGMFVLDEDAFSLVYSGDNFLALKDLVSLVGPPHTRNSALNHPAELAKIEILLSGWGAPTLDEAFLRLCPNLKAIFYGAGSMAGVLTPAAWERSILCTSALNANAVPVAEYSLSAILFSLKHGWRLARETRDQCTFPNRNAVPGCFESSVGLISLGAIGRALLKLLQPFDLNVLVYDPFLSAEEASLLGVELVSLEDIFLRSHAVSLHAPHLPETEGLVSGVHLASMQPGATFINTARAEIVRQDEMIEVARCRPDLQFVLDVAYPEPPGPDSLLYKLPNVVLTPHIAGSAGNECRRMGRHMVHELRRYLAGEPLQSLVTPESALNSSHRPLTYQQAISPAHSTPPKIPEVILPPASRPITPATLSA